MLWISPLPFRALGIENDRFSGGKRRLAGASVGQDVAMLGNAALNIAGNWLNIDHRLGLISMDGFQYTGPKDFNRKSAAYDTVTPNTRSHAWQMISRATVEQTRNAASHFSETLDGATATVTASDGSATYVINVNFDNIEVSIHNEN